MGKSERVDRVDGRLGLLFELDEAGFLHRLLERRAELGGRVDHDDAGLFERGDLVLGLALATRDDGTGVTHCNEGERFIRFKSAVEARARGELWSSKRVGTESEGGREDVLRRPGGAVRPLCVMQRLCISDANQKRHRFADRWWESAIGRRTR